MRDKTLKTSLFLILYMENYIYIETYGCSANQNNSEILAGILASKGYKITNNPDIAEIIIINSCVVKGKTENKIKRRIQDLKQGDKFIRNPTVIKNPLETEQAVQICRTYRKNRAWRVLVW